MTFRQLGIIGCGLMGCSFALAARRAGMVERIVGFSPSPETTGQVQSAGIIDEAAASASAAVVGSDLVLLAVPVGALPALFREIRPQLGDDMLVMDVGSTKQDVVLAARQELGEQGRAFVAAHPIAGKESSGFQHADAALFDGRQVVLTPDDTTSIARIEQATEVWHALGAHVNVMTPQQHDAAFAAVSHLPHLLAFAYVNGLLSQPRGEQWMAQGGTGFRDFSRIAGSDPAMWRDIFQANRTEILAQLQTFHQALESLTSAIEHDDASLLAQQIGEASRARRAWTMADKTAP